MAKRVVIFLWLVVSFINQATYANPEGVTSGLKGTITDKNSGEPLPGVSIYFPDLKTGTISLADGTYSINNLPKAKLTVQVSFIGYKLILRQIDLSTVEELDFSLEEAATEISEVVVTGQLEGTEQKRTPSPITIIPHSELLQNTSSNIIDAISTEPGVAQVTTGAGISKPIIRGLGYNRVVVVNDGIRQEGQQWGDEHGIELDEYNIGKVEILKGPASLMYGSDAMAGVINMISEPTMPAGVVRGNIYSNYQTNNGLQGVSLNLAGNKSGLVWSLRYSNKRAHAFQNKYDGYVFNSGFKEDAFSGLVGINRSWGYSHLNMSVYNLQPGIVEGERDSISGQFVKPVITDGEISGVEPATNSDLKSYRFHVPFQKIHHYKAVWDNSLFIGDGYLKTTFGFQQNHRKEYGESPDRYGLYFVLNTLNYSVQYVFPEENGYKLTSGLSGMWQQSRNKGTEFLVPAYHLFDAGFYILANRKFGEVDISGGLRYDRRWEQGKDLFVNEDGEKVSSGDPEALHRFRAFDRDFEGIAGSIGATWQISESAYTKINVSRGFRAPNISELGSNGEHEGTLRYEVGNPDLKPESSLQFDFALGFDTHHVSAELNLFHNNINHFIFSHKLNSSLGGDSLIDAIPVFKFSSGKAQLYGGEIRIDIHPHPVDWLHFENTFSYVNAILKDQPDSSHYLPLTPAPLWRTSIKTDIKKINEWMKDAYLKAGFEWTLDQDHFYAAYGTETGTPGYFLLNFGAGTRFVSGNKTLASLFIGVNNLMDIAYQSHLSRLKYGEVNHASGREGVFNMGRNVSFKLIVPINF